MQKKGARWCDSGRAGADGRPWEYSDRKIVSQCRDPARWTYNGAVFEVKKAVQFFLQHKFVAALTVFSLSFSVRLAMLMYLGHIERRGTGEVDSIALALLSKHQFADPYAVATGPTAHTTPFYPLVVAGVYALFGHGNMGYLVRSLLVIGAYSLLYSSYIWLAHSFGFSKGVGLIAGFSAALLPVKRSAEVFRGWEEPYAAMGLAVLLLFTLRHWRAPCRKARMAVLLGVAWGAVFYISFSLAAVLAGVILMDAVVRPSWATVRDNALIVLAAVAVMSPWVIRNSVELHSLVLMRTAFGQNLWCSNNDHAHPSVELINADPIALGMYPYTSVQEALKVRQMGEAAYDRYDLQRALQWIRQNPRKFADLSLLRFLYFWGGPLEHPFELIVTTLYTLAGLLGLFVMKRYVGILQWQLWIATLVSFPAVYYFAQYATRYRTPIDWMIWLSAGQALIVITRRVWPDGVMAERTTSEPTISAP